MKDIDTFDEKCWKNPYFTRFCVLSRRWKKNCKSKYHGATPTPTWPTLSEYLLSPYLWALSNITYEDI